MAWIEPKPAAHEHPEAEMLKTTDSVTLYKRKDGQFIVQFIGSEYDLDIPEKVVKTLPDAVKVIEDKLEAINYHSEANLWRDLLKSSKSDKHWYFR